jgi:uncharacterized membrane protein YphA (DoxX/SURF4 family)
MNPRLEKNAIPALRWTLGLVLFLESALFVFSPSAAQHFAETGFPPWIRPVLGGGEIIAALLFLLPATSVAAGYLLLVILAIAVVVHLLHGEFNVGVLLVYAMATFVSMTHRPVDSIKVAHD